MDGVFMGKLWKRIGICLVLAALVWCGTVLSDRETLNNGLIRLHVVANSDSEEDQAVKLKVRDAILTSIQEDLQNVADVSQAKAYLEENLPKLQSVANATLQAAGFAPDAVVTLCREAFDIRHYDTFTLPSGVYDALRVTIGEGEGYNWWCVAFPSLCLSATTERFAETAAEAGFPDSLTKALSEDGGVELRFFFLDAIGKLQTAFFAS